jgi:pilus assembly protein CpaD
MISLGVPSSGQTRAMRNGLTVALLALALAGCDAVDRMATSSIVKDDYRERHRITMMERPVVLNLFPTGSQIDSASERRLIQFAEAYRAEGEGRLEILMPSGGVNESHARASISALRSILGRAGIDKDVSEGSYPVADPRANSPIRLIYRATRAKVVHRCGEWPADLSIGGPTGTWDNRPYWDFGCSYQSMFANQTADPRDLEAPRATTPNDVAMRMRGIEKVRAGSDPATDWKVENTKISNVGGR